MSPGLLTGLPVTIKFSCPVLRWEILEQFRVVDVLPNCCVRSAHLPVRLSLGLLRQQDAQYPARSVLSYYPALPP